MPVAPSLENSETSADPHIRHDRYGPADYDDAPPIEPLESRFRHSCWAKERRRIYEAGQLAGLSDRRRRRFADCGSNAGLAASADDLCVLCDHCRDRWCVPCQTSRRAALSAEVVSRLRDTQSARMLTLTLKSLRVHKLEDLLSRLQDSFRRLRQRKWWQEHVTGGVCCLEVKRGKRGNWHPHLHLVCVGRNVKHRELSAEWLAVTGDSSIVWVTPIASSEVARQDVSTYVTKYATKPISTVTMSLQEIADAMIALKGKRLIQAFGTWSGIGVEDDSPADPPKRICRLSAIWDAGNERWLAAALRKWPVLSEWGPAATVPESDFPP
jgi:hypothetical protein